MNKKYKFLRVVLIAFLSIFITICSFGGGFVAGQFLPIQIKPNLAQSEATPEDLRTLFTPFWEAWEIVHKQYIEQPVNDTKLMEGAIRGMLESLGDPYSGYWDPQETDAVYTAMSGEYEGIGAWVDVRGEYLTIIDPMPGYPAEAVGLISGDQIIAVDGEDVTGIDPEIVRITQVMGLSGTNVTLTIYREGVEEPFDVTITRAQIVVASVKSEILENNIGYLQITEFGEKTADEVHQALTDFNTQGVNGIVLDLRDNGGGLTDAATSVASEFIADGVVWYEQYNDGSRTTHNAQPGGLALDIPLVVLINQNSASASELVVGAIQDYERGQLVGVTTFGKGVVQMWLPISSGGTVRITEGYWLTPRGRMINDIGLTPDVIIEITKEDITANLDPQMDTAVQLLLIH